MKNINRKIVISISLAFIGGILFGFLIYSVGKNSYNSSKTLYIAPYLTRTHDCYNHDPGCQGELNNLAVSYTIQDGRGNLIESAEVTTEANGFFAVSIPSNRAYQIKITTEINTTQYRAYTQISSYEDSPNCITNVHLEKIP